jgi:hypothetical protein
MRFYDLWSLRPGNLVGECQTEEDALATVRGLLAAGSSADDLSLGWGDTDDAERGGEIASGAELANRALVRSSEDPSLSA